MPVPLLRAAPCALILLLSLPGHADPAAEAAAARAARSVAVHTAHPAALAPHTPQPRIAPGELAVEGSARRRVGDSLTLAAEVRNEGEVEVAEAVIILRRSDDPLVNEGDPEVFRGSVPTIPAGQRHAGRIRLKTPSQAGRYYFALCVPLARGGEQCSTGTRVIVADRGLSADSLEALPE